MTVDKTKPRTVKTAPEIKRAIVLRAAGYSLSVIADKTDISKSTLQRHFKKHSIDKGTISAKAIDDAKQELVADGLTEALKQEVISAVLDDVSQFKAIRAALATNIEELVEDGSLSPHYRSRGLTAVATGLRLSQEVIRKALDMDTTELEQSEIATLEYKVLSQDDVEEIRELQLKGSHDIGDGDIVVAKEGNEIVEEC